MDITHGKIQALKKSREEVIQISENSFAGREIEKIFNHLSPVFGHEAFGMKTERHEGDIPDATAP